MSDWQNLRSAEAIIAAADRGDYDEALGISPDERALITRATSEEPLQAADVTALAAINRHDLISAAYDSGRIDLDTPPAEKE